jgi:hypothetical protein
MPRLLLVLFVAAVGCAPDLRDEFPWDGELPDGVYLTHEDQDDGSVITSVDATHKESWVFLDLDRREQLEGAEAVASADWELAFQRFKIATNSGVTGVGAVETAVLTGTDFGSLARAPAEGYQRDRPDSSDGDSDVDSAFLSDGGWYAYDLIKHRLLPRELLYVVKSSEGAYFKIQLLSYYDRNGSSARPSFRWAKISAP